MKKKNQDKKFSVLKGHQMKSLDFGVGIPCGPKPI